MTTALMLVLGIVLTAGTFVFVSAEFSLVAVDQAVLDKKAEEGDRGASSVLRATRTLSTQLSGAQVGITLTTILLGYTTQSALAGLLEDLLGSAGLAWGLATGIAAFVAAAFINVFSMLFGELVPKNLALAHPLATAVRVVPFQMAFTAIARPVIWVLGGTANWVLARMGIEPQEEISSARSASELAALVEYSVEEGTFDMSTADLFVNTIRMSTLSAAYVMTDRGRLHTLEADDSAEDVVHLARATGHSRFPVIGRDVDDVMGIVHLRRAIGVPYERRADVPVASASLMTPAPRVPETMPLADLLVELRAQGSQMALVVDEYGGTAGVVTLEDAVEEVVGDVADEHDRRRAGAHLDPSGHWVVPGWMRPDELATRAAIQVPDDGPYETLGGLVMTELGRIPVVGDVVELAHASLTVDAMDGRRVTRLHVRPKDPEATPGDHQGAEGECR